MNDLDPAELSALLDGELDPERARAIEALLDSDPALKAMFDELKLADRRLASMAAAAAFRADVSWPAQASAFPATPGSGPASGSATTTAPVPVAVRAAARDPTIPMVATARTGAWRALPPGLIVLAWLAGKLLQPTATAFLVNAASLLLLLACLLPAVLREVRAGGSG